MTKQIIRTRLEGSDWILSMQEGTVEEAIAYLSKYPPKTLLDIDWDYDGKYGEMYSIREETDDEYTARLAQEAEEQRQREEAQRKADEQLAERMMLIAAKDVAFKAYMEKHKDNPNIGDLSNLLMAVMSLTKAGAKGSVTGPLLECMERLENGK